MPAKGEVIPLNTCLENEAYSFLADPDEPWACMASVADSLAGNTVVFVDKGGNVKTWTHQANVAGEYKMIYRGTAKEMFNGF